MTDSRDSGDETEKLTPLEVGEIVLSLDVDDEIRFAFEWDGLHFEEEATVVDIETRGDNEIHPGDVPKPYFMTARTDEGIEYVFPTAHLDGEFVPSPFTACEDIERRRPHDEKSSQISGSKVTAIEVNRDE